MSKDNKVVEELNIISIGGKNYEMSFGLKFQEILDLTYVQEDQGMELAVGIEMAITYLAMENNVALANVINASLAHLGNKRPSEVAIEKEMEDRAIKGELFALFDHIMEAMEHAPFLKEKMQSFKQHALLESEQNELGEQVQTES